MFLGGCQKDNPKKPINPDEKPGKVVEISDSEQRVMASKISNLAEEVEGIERATVIITRADIIDKNYIKKAEKQKNKNKKIPLPDGGMIILIGASVSDNLRDKSEDWDKARDEVIAKVKAADINISQVHVTINPELVGDIDGIAAAFLQGEPINKYEDDIKAIIAKIKK